MSSDLFRRPTTCYEIIDMANAPPWFDIIVEPGVCDEFRVWQKWQDGDLNFEIFLGVDADGRFGVELNVKVVKELSADYHYTNSWI